MSIMEKRNTLDERFINLREIFHDFQTTVRFSTSNSTTEIFANQLKAYQFLGQLQEHFVAQKVQYLYEFVHSIFSLIFTMIRESPAQRCQKSENIKKLKTTDTGTQTEQKNCEDQKKMPKQANNYTNTRHKKRSCLQIQIFEKDLTQMSLRQRRRALQKMRDMIYTEDDQAIEPNAFLKDFKPNIDKISYSRSDQSIKAAIDTFKESDISTHIFLKHFMEEFVEIKDIKNSSQLLNKELIQSMSKAITKYKGVKIKGKQKFRVFSHTIEQIIYPSMNLQQYVINISQKHGGESLNSIDEKYQGEKDQSTLLQDVSNLSMSKNKKTINSKLKFQVKRSKFPSLLLKSGEELIPISQTSSQSSLGSSKSLISKKSSKHKASRKKMRSSFSQDEFSKNLIGSSSKKQLESDQVSLLSQKNNNESKFRSRKSFRLDKNQNDSSDLIEREKQNLKQKQALNPKKLRKRKGSNFLDKIQDRLHRKSLQVS